MLVKEVTLQGCAKDCGVNQGGLIYNNEYLGLEYVKLTGGFAGQGGAIYNVATLLEDGTSRSLVEIRSTLVEQNQAVQGAILYGEAPSFRIYNSVFKENKTTDASSANIYSVNNAAVKEDTTLSSLASRLVSSTFVKNTGYVVNVRDGMALNNLTVVGNSNGIYFNPSTNLALDHKNIFRLLTRYPKYCRLKIHSTDGPGGGLPPPEPPHAGIGSARTNTRVWCGGPGEQQPLLVCILMLLSIRILGRLLDPSGFQ